MQCLVHGHSRILGVLMLLFQLTDGISRLCEVPFQFGAQGIFLVCLPNAPAELLHLSFGATCLKKKIYQNT